MNECCDLDEQTFYAIKLYYLALVYKQLGGEDVTDYDGLVTEFGEYLDYSESNFRALILVMVISLVHSYNIDVSLEEARLASSQVRNTFSLQQLKAFEELLWHRIAVILGVQ